MAVYCFFMHETRSCLYLSSFISMGECLKAGASTMCTAIYKVFNTCSVIDTLGWDVRIWFNLLMCERESEFGTSIKVDHVILCNILRC